MKCQMSHSKKGRPVKVELEFENDVITESTFTSSTGKPRSVQIPKGLYGDDPKLYIGRRQLELASQGFQFDREDTELAKDRIHVSVHLDGDLLSLLCSQLVQTPSQLSQLSDQKVLSHGMLVTLFSNGNAKELSIAFLRSALNAQQATLLALAFRCTNGTAMAADFLGEAVDLPALIKPLRNFDSLSDSVLDRFDAHGITLRLVDFRKIEPVVAGFVGF